MQDEAKTRVKSESTSDTITTTVTAQTVRAGITSEGEEYTNMTRAIKSTIDQVVPKKKNMFKNGRTVSEETKALYKQRKREFSKNKPNEATRKKWNRKIRNTGRNDYRDWVSRWTEQIEKTDAKGDLKAVYRGVKALSGSKNRFSCTQPTLNANGARLKSPNELANMWKTFLGRKFEPTDLEKIRAEYDALPDRAGNEGEL